MSVTVHLEDDLDVSRGDLICRPHNHPQPSREIDATICWTCARAGSLPLIAWTPPAAFSTAKVASAAVSSSAIKHRRRRPNVLGRNRASKVVLRLEHVRGRPLSRTSAVAELPQVESPSPGAACYEARPTSRGIVARGVAGHVKQARRHEAACRSAAPSLGSHNDVERPSVRHGD